MTILLSLCLLMGAVYETPAPYAQAAGWNYQTWPNNAKMKNGVGDYGRRIRYDWIDQSAMEYEDYIVQARNDWVYTTDILYTPIDIARTYTKKSSVFEVHKSQEQPDIAGIYAETHFYEFANSTGDMDNGADPSRDYYWTMINLNTSNFARLSTNDGGLNHKKGTIAHEFGHAFGLAHLPDSVPNKRYCIMCQSGKGRHVDTPQKDDLQGINYLYG